MPASPSRPNRVIDAQGHSNIARLGDGRAAFGDPYHFLITRSWPALFLFITLVYLCLNVIFALIYLAGGDAIVNARPGSFADAFFFSVHTLATIGYGTMAPHGLYGNVLVTIEALLGLLGLALMTGLVFAKFSQPTARVLFSRNAVISSREGKTSLMFRMANRRANQIVEAHLRVILVRNDRTAEGEPLRRIHELKLVRDDSPLLILSWTAIHPIDESSPLHGETSESLAASEAEIIVVLVGIDETFSQTIHARYSYTPDEIVWNARFADILCVMPDGRRAIDYGLFHEVIRLPS